MLSSKVADYDAPAVAARVVEFANQGGIAPTVIVQNLDAAASSAIKFQESNDKSTWSDIAGTSATVNPSTSNSQQVVSSMAFVALHAGGNVKLLVSVNRTVNGSPSDLGTA